MLREPPCPPGLKLRWNEDEAHRSERFFEAILRHTKGRWARTPFLLEPFQRDELIRPLFGWQVFDPQWERWVRLYREVWFELARKNGKSEILAGLALKLLVADDEESAEIYGAAYDKEQAGLVFNVAARMVELSPHLRSRLRVITSRKRIYDPKTNSVYRVISADSMGQLGQDPSGIIFDEVVAQKNRELYDALRTGFGSREQPLMVMATTAGPTAAQFAAHEHEISERIAGQPDLSPRRLVVMRNTPEDIDIWDEQNWYHANPALGKFLSMETLRTEARDARLDGTKEIAFRIFRLNQWINALKRWMPLAVWDHTAGMVERDDLIGRECWIGMDLSATTDLTAVCLFFPPVFDEETDDRGAVVGRKLAEPGTMLWRFWVTQTAGELLNEKTGGKFGQWAKDGFVTVTSGDVIDYDTVEADVISDAADFDVRTVRIDRWNSTATAGRLERAGIDVHTVDGSFATFSEPMKELFRMTKEQEFRHGGNPVARYCIDCTTVRMDEHENIKPVKVRDRDQTGRRIDGTVTAIYAVGAWLADLNLEEAVPGFYSLARQEGSA